MVPVGAYITLTVTGRHLKRGRSTQIGAAILDNLASEFCKRWLRATESMSTTKVGFLQVVQLKLQEQEVLQLEQNVL